jgi:hypothetical protein
VNIITNEICRIDSSGQNPIGLDLRKKKNPHTNIDYSSPPKFLLNTLKDYV